MNEFEAHEGSYDHLHKKVGWNECFFGEKAGESGDLKSYVVAWEE